ncbi:MAG: type II toxin-antitoxin system RelE/ParE family toxin [Alphaproteobacteria bacterium]|nr:type II toxin-antitoxin system RelE/ParE family toxin [Alphaproteobacteria bacterium]
MPHIPRLMNLYFTRTYERAIRKLLADDARAEMEAAIVAAPDAAPVIRGTGGIRKLRWAGSGRGKRGGIRAIYFWHTGPGAIYVLTAYAKADRDDLSPADRRALVRVVATIEQERGEG